MIKRSRPLTDRKDEHAVSEAVRSGMHATGDKTRSFERAFSRIIGTRYATATNSGTSAIHLALLSLGITKNDEVITSTYVCQAVMNAIRYAEANPILADIDPDYEKGLNVSSQTIKPRVSKKTKAIILPHMFGMPCEVDKIRDLKVPIIEDCAQSLGVRYRKRLLGSHGDLGVFSFFATKMISTGQGGMITTNSKKLHDCIRNLMEYDKREKYQTTYNYGMTGIQASLGLSQLKKLNSFNRRRLGIKKKYDRAFKDLPIKTVPSVIPYKYVILTDRKEQLKKHLWKSGIKTDDPVFRPLHRYLHKKGYPNADNAFRKALTLPLYPALKDSEVRSVIKKVKDFYEG